jgi:hypothetical protein
MSDIDHDWLNIDSPPVKIDRAVVEASPQYQALVKAFAPLSPSQRDYVRSLPEAHYVPARVLKNLQARGMKISPRTVYRWQTDPAVKYAVACYRELASEFAGIDALSVMLRVSAWAEYCEELVPMTDNNGHPVLDADGKPTLKKRDVANGLKALELLGRHTKAIGPESAGNTSNQRQLPAFVIGVNIQTAPTKPEAIDVQITEVPSEKN